MVLLYQSILYVLYVIVVIKPSLKLDHTQYFQRNDENASKKSAASGINARGTSKFGQKRTKINSLNEKKSGILRMLTYQRSLERIHFLFFVIVVI